MRATRINEEMKVAAVHALKDLAREPVPQAVLEAYEKDAMSFGREYIIPTPVDVRLLERVTSAVAQAAVDSGVAQKALSVALSAQDHRRGLWRLSQVLARGPGISTATTRPSDGGPCCICGS